MYVPFSGFDPLSLKLHIFWSERSPRWYRNAYITAVSVVGIVALDAVRDTSLATVTWRRVFAAACLLQEVPEAGGGLQLDRRLDYLLRMTPARAVAVGAGVEVVVEGPAEAGVRCLGGIVGGGVWL